MTLGERIRELRLAKQFTLRDLAAKVGVGFTYISRIENHKLEVGHGFSEKLLHKLAAELETYISHPTFVGQDLSGGHLRT